MNAVKRNKSIIISLTSRVQLAVLLSTEMLTRAYTDCNANGELYFTSVIMSVIGYCITIYLAKLGDKPLYV